MGTEQRTRLGVEYRLDHALGLAERDRLAVSDIGKMADLELVAGFPRLGFRQPDRGDLRHAVGAAWDVRNVEGMNARDAGQLPDADHALVAGLVREPGRPDQIPDGIDAQL